MRIVVTGGAGFIGSNFVRHLLEAYLDYKVVILDKFTYAGNPDNIAELERDERVSLLVGDICDPLILNRMDIWGEVTHIVNFAAESFVDHSIHSGQDPFTQSNVQGVMNLLRWVRKHPKTRYVQIGTDEVYGDTDLDSQYSFNETDLLTPNNPYSATKAAADHLVHAFVHTYGIHASITRCSNNYGPYQFPEKFIPVMIKKALKNEPLPIYAKGENIRDWIHVRDHCRAIDAVMHHGKPGRVYNIGGHEEHQNIDVAKCILDILDKPHSLLEHVTDRPGHDRRYAIDTSYIERELAWVPTVSFAQGLVGTVQWYVSNQEWLRRIETGEYRWRIPA